MFLCPVNDPMEGNKRDNTHSKKGWHFNALFLCNLFRHMHVSRCMYGQFQDNMREHSCQVRSLQERDVQMMICLLLRDDSGFDSFSFFL